MQNKTIEKIHASTRKTPMGYEGYVFATLGRARMWTRYTKIVRVNNYNATIDAFELLEDILQENNSYQCYDCNAIVNSLTGYYEVKAFSLLNPNKKGVVCPKCWKARGQSTEAIV